MNTEAWMQLGKIGFNAIDGLGNWAADKLNEKKIKEDLQEQRELEESYRERILGPGQGGGFSGHLASRDESKLKYFMPAIQSAAEFGYYQLADLLNNKAKKKKPASDPDNNNPNDTSDAGTEPINEEPVQAQGTQSTPTTNLGSTPTWHPVGMTSNPSFGGIVEDFQSNFGQKPLGTLIQQYGVSAKKGAKLIPRQK